MIERSESMSSAQRVLDRLVMRLRRKIYVYGVLKGIETARDQWMYVNKQSRTSGLSVIRRFESINGVQFNWFDVAHRDAVRSKANHEAFFRNANRILKRYKK